MTPEKPAASLLARYIRWGDWIMLVFRLDLQVHFFWGLFLTLAGIYWPPLLASGFVVTVVKEFLDLWSKGHWSWGDFWWGTAGSAAGVWIVLH